MPSRSVGAAKGTASGPVLNAGAKAAAGDAGPTRRPARVRPAVHPSPAASFSLSPAGGFIADTVAMAWRVLESARAPAGVFTAETVGVFSGKRSTSRSRGIAGGGVRSAARPARVNAGVTSAGDGAFAFAAPGVVSTTADVVFAGIGTGLPARVRERSGGTAGATRGTGRSATRSASKRFGCSFSAETRGDAERVAGDAGVSAGASRGTPPSERSCGVIRVVSIRVVSLAAAAEGRKAALALAVSASARAAAASASASARSRSARARATRARASASSLSRSSSFFARSSAAFSAAAARSATPRASNWSAREIEIRRAES